MTLLKLSTACLAIAETLYHEFPTQSIDRLGTYTIESDRLFEGLGVVLTTCVEERYSLHHFAQRDTTAIVANAHNLACIARLIGIRTHSNLDGFAFVHTELIDGVVDGLFDEYIDTIVVVLAIAQFADIHTGTAADMLAVVEMDNVVVVVGGGWIQFFCHC